MMNNILVKLSRVIALIVIGAFIISCTDAAFDGYVPEQGASDADIKYADYIGAWQVSGDIYVDGKVVNNIAYEVSVEQKVKGLSYFVRGWAGSPISFDFPFEMLYNSDGSVTIYTNQKLGEYDFDNTGKATVRLAMANDKQKLMPLNYKGYLRGELNNGAIRFTSSDPGFTLAYCNTRGDVAFYLIGDEYPLLAPTMKQLPKTAPFYMDKSVTELQQHTLGNGIDLIIVGDGYTSEYDFGVGGKFITDAQNCMEAFFEVEPMKSLRNYFNVKVIASYSKDRGVSSGYSALRRETLFEVKLTDILSSSNVGVNYDKVHSYVYSVISGGDKSKRGFNVILVMANQDESAGTAYINNSDTYTNVAVVPITGKQDGFEAIVRHEAVGHAFGLLLDEYIYYGEQIPESDKKSTLENMKDGFGANLTFESRENAHWAKYYDIDGYDMVGYFEGGLKYQYGVWRSEEFSCMDNNVPYFTAPSREKIYSRVMEHAGIAFDFQQFVEYDKVNIENSRSMKGIGGTRLTDDLIILKNFPE